MSGPERLLLRFLLATTEDECYTDEIIRVRELTARYLRLPPPPAGMTTLAEEREWRKVIEARLAERAAA